MAISLQTDDFVEMLKAAQVTTFTGKDDPIMRCVLLDTARAAGEESGETDVLVAVSGDRNVWGHYIAPADGQLDNPLVINIAENKWIIGSVTAAKKNMQELEGKNAECRVSLSVTGTGSNARLVVQTTTDGIRGEKDIEAIIPLESEEYPIVTAEQYLSGKSFRVDGESYDDLPDGVVMGFDSSATAVMDKISGVIKENVIQYPTGHSAGRRILTCGERWRGSVPGYAFTPEQADGPIVEFVSVAREDSEDTGENVGETE